MSNWNKTKILQLVDNKVQENLQLEYKAAGSLGRQNNQTDEITKDISAMANGAGGVIIYGVCEYREKDKRHLPERLDPVNREDFSREWLEQTIQTIQPRIDNFVIHSVDDDATTNGCFYVVEVPQSSTAHQAKDHRYYKRLNFTVVAMEDYEIRDVMNRRKHPYITLTCKIEKYITRSIGGIPNFGGRKDDDAASLEVYATNQGAVFAQYIVATVEVPILLSSVYDISERGYIGPKGEIRLDDWTGTMAHTLSNQKQDTNGMGMPIGDKRYEPLLPGLTTLLGSIGLNLKTLEEFDADAKILWTANADNSAPNTGVILLRDIPITDERDT